MSSLSQGGLTALTWVFAATATGLTAGRFIIRKKTINQLLWDDYVHGLALMVLIAFLVTYTVMFPLNYAVEFWAAGEAPEPTMAQLDRYFRLEIAVSMMFWVIVYLVKVSFLLFYHQLFSVSNTFIKAWWAVIAFTVVSFLICFLSVLWGCGVPERLFVVESCLSSDVSPSIVKVSAVFNIFSDITVMALPLWMLSGLQMRPMQKMGLGALFLLATIDVLFDILRTVYSVDGGIVALDTIWDVLEPTVAVIISSLPTYRALFGLSNSKSSKGSSYRNLQYQENSTSTQRSHQLSQVQRPLDSYPPVPKQMV